VNTKKIIKAGTLSLMLSSANLATLTYSSTAVADASNAEAYAKLQEGMPYLFVVHKGRSIKIVRNIEQSFQLPSNLKNTLLNKVENCPPFCLQPFKLDDLPVATLSEVGVINFMTDYLRNNTGALIDVRSASSYARRTIPGSMNYFVQTIQKGLGDSEFDAMFAALGVKPRNEVSWLTRQLESLGVKDSSEVSDTLDFTNAKELVIWGRAQTDINVRYAIRALLDAGYPAHKIRWYHGGLASWVFWGFTTYSEPKQY
jgi:rhodanese-related sulfurtransferase